MLVVSMVFPCQFRYAFHFPWEQLQQQKQYLTLSHLSLDLHLVTSGFVAIDIFQAFHSVFNTLSSLGADNLSTLPRTVYLTLTHQQYVTMSLRLVRPACGTLAGFEEHARL